MTRKLLMGSLFVLFLAGAVFANGSYELGQAKAAMDRGDFRYAIDQFRYMATNTTFAPEVRREAMYFIGFCYVKMSDPWSAIDGFTRFLDKYGSSSNEYLLPDAMYVLGRTYEEVGRTDDARRLYRRCRERFPYNDFTRKCEDRLRVLGDSYYPPNPPYPPPHPPHPGYGITPEVRDMIELAKMADSYSADQMLLKACNRAQIGADFVAISKATRNQYTQFQVFELAQKSRVYQMMTPYEAVDLAKTTTNSYYRNQFLVEFARKRGRYAEDFRVLVEATTDSFSKSQIMQIAQEKLGNGPRFAISMSVEEQPVAKAKKPATKAAKVQKAVSDPFDGFRVDAEKVRRITWFVDAVKHKKNIDETARQLKKEDMTLDVVRQSVKECDAMKKFDNLHSK